MYLIVTSKYRDLASYVSHRGEPKMMVLKDIALIMSPCQGSQGIFYEVLPHSHSFIQIQVYKSLSQLFTLVALFTLGSILFLFSNSKCNLIIDFRRSGQNLHSHARFGAPKWWAIPIYVEFIKRVLEYSDIGRKQTSIQLVSNIDDSTGTSLYFVRTNILDPFCISMRCPSPYSAHAHGDHGL